MQLEIADANSSAFKKKSKEAFQEEYKVKLEDIGSKVTN